MTRTPVLDRFGQDVPSHQLDSMARGIVSGIGDGRPASGSGFAWYQPQGLFQQNLIRRSQKLRLAKAA
jgi:hypothetical protein